MQPFSVPRPEPPYWHCSSREFAEGTVLTPPNARGQLPSWAPARAAVAAGRRYPGYVEGVVYVLTQQSRDWRTIPGSYAFADDAAFIYEVEPAGPIHHDPASTYQFFWYCKTATIIRCVRRALRSE